MGAGCTHGGSNARAAFQFQKTELRWSAGVLLMLDVISAAAAVVQTVVVVLGVRYAVTSLRQNEQARNLEIIKTMLDAMSSPAGYVERYAILERGTVHPEGLTREDYLLYLRTCEQFQRICSLARHEPLTVVRMFSATLVSIWGCVELFVLDVRARRGLTNFAEDFEWFAERAGAYRRQRFPGEMLRLGLDPPESATGTVLSAGGS